MKPPSRQSKPFKFFDDQLAQAEASKPKKTKKIEPYPPKAIPATDPPAPEIAQIEAHKPTKFSPPVDVGFESFKVNIEERTLFDIFMKLFSWESLVAVVVATNAYAAADVAPRQQYARTWHPLSTGELLCWLGLLFCMGAYPMKRREDYWPRFRIPEGYKVWALGFKGYYYDWLCYSLVIGSEDYNNKRSSRFSSRGPTTTVLLADTFQVPVRLC